MIHLRQYKVLRKDSFRDYIEILVYGFHIFVQAIHNGSLALLMAAYAGRRVFQVQILMQNKSLSGISCAR